MCYPFRKLLIEPKQLGLNMEQKTYEYAACNVCGTELENYNGEMYCKFCDV